MAMTSMMMTILMIISMNNTSDDEDYDDHDDEDNADDVENGHAPIIILSMLTTAAWDTFATQASVRRRFTLLLRFVEVG